MRSRKDILKDLVLLHGNVEDLEMELSQYPWDIEVPLLNVREQDFINVLQKCIDNEIDFQILSNWANTIECRDDLDFASEKMREIIFELANPEINGEITKERLNEFISELIT